MKETHFLGPSPAIDAAQTRIERLFLTGEQPLNSNELKAFAHELAEDIKQVIQAAATPSEQLAIIVHLFNAKNLLADSQQFGFRVRWLRPANLDEEEPDDENLASVAWRDDRGEVQTAELSVHELESFLYPIRKAILDELAESVDRKMLHVVSKQLTSDRRVWEVHDEKILKLAIDHDPEGQSETEENKENRLEALQQLFGLPERSPFIAYQVLNMEFTTAPFEGLEVQRKLHMQTVDEILNKENVPPLKDVLRYALDGMRGAAFLVDHGLRLTDFSPHNISIDLSRDRGFLFDYDGLRTEEYILAGGLVTHKGYQPPERLLPSPATREIGDPPPTLDPHTGLPVPIEGPITPAEMIYEFGCLLQDILKRYPESNRTLEPLITRLRQRKPSNRPTFPEAIAELESLITRIEIQASAK